MTNDEGGVGIGELSRQVRDVLVRFEGLVARLDSSFLQKELYNLRQQVIDKSFVDLETGKADKSTTEELRKRIENLEDDKKWLVRLVIGFIILGILGAIFVASGVPK